jgi:NADP-dependent 3-hydroxy acid dehydrogenase YdfG
VRVIPEGLQQEVKPYNIRSTVISPGMVATELTDSITASDIARSCASATKAPFPQTPC